MSERGARLRPLPRKLFAHLEMLRPYTLCHPALLAIAGAELASGGRARPRVVALTASVVTCGWLAAHYAGDYYDREIDAIGKPTRPIPSGRISPREALIAMWSLITLGCTAALAVSRGNLVLALVTTTLGIGYSKVFKARALLGNLDRGVLGACAVAFGALGVGRLTPRIATLMLLVMAHDSATNLVGAVRDVDGDREAGCRTAAVVYGRTRMASLATALGGVALLLGAILLSRPRANGVAQALFGLAAALAGSAYVPLLGSPGAASRTRARRAHERLVPERIVLTSAIVAVFRPRLALAMLAIALPLSLGLQRLLRGRYEPAVLGEVRTLRSG